MYVYNSHENTTSSILYITLVGPFWILGTGRHAFLFLIPFSCTALFKRFWLVMNWMLNVRHSSRWKHFRYKFNSNPYEAIHLARLRVLVELFSPKLPSRFPFLIENECFVLNEVVLHRPSKYYLNSARNPWTWKARVEGKMNEWVQKKLVNIFLALWKVSGQERETECKKEIAAKAKDPSNQTTLFHPAQSLDAFLRLNVIRSIRSVRRLLLQTMYWSVFLICRFYQKEMKWKK